MGLPDLDRRPVIVAVAGPNGAGKSTFYRAHLAATGLRFINADVIARELNLDAYTAAAAAETLRKELVRQRESFVFETVLSDPVGEKVAFLEAAAKAGYNIILCYIGLADAGVSEERVSMRVSQGGHDVPTEKLAARYPRTIANLGRAIRQLPRVLIFENNDLRRPFQHVAASENGRIQYLAKPIPEWLELAARS